MFRSTAFVAFLCLVAHGLAFAENTGAVPDSIRLRVSDVLVEAPRLVTAVGGAAAVQVVVDSLPVPTGPTVEEVLRQIPLLHVRTNSRGEAEISARGSESRQVAVLVDGVPITLAWDARADVSVIPTTALQDVVFVRGLSSMLYGPNVLGGIVETRIGGLLYRAEGPSTQFCLGADDVGTYRTTLTTALPFETDRGQLVMRGGVGYRNTPGDPLARNVTESAPHNDDLRLNTDAESLDGFLAARYLAEGGAWASLSGSSFREERGIAAELGVADEDARLWRYPHVSRTLAVLSGGTGVRNSPLGGRGDLQASLGLDRGRTDIDEYTSRSYQEIGTFENGKDRTLTLRLLTGQTLGERGDLRAAFTLASIRHTEIIPDGEFVYRQRLGSVGLENTWRLTTSGNHLNSLSLSVSGAYDVGKTPEAGGREPLGQISEWGGRAGLSAVVAEGRTVLHAAVSRRGRFPALRELYSGALGRFAPNPNLVPERLVTAEAGVTCHLGSGELQLVGFENQLNDAVVRITLEDRRFMRVNRDELRSSGVELLGAYALGPVDLAGSVTLQDVKLTDPEADETHRPENLPEAFGEMNVRFPLVRSIFAGIAVDYTGSQFCIDPATGEDSELPAQAIVNTYVARTWPLAASWAAGTFSQLETRIALDNAGDVALYDACGLPEPGRRIRFELRWR